MTDRAAKAISDLNRDVRAFANEYDEIAALDVKVRNKRVIQDYSVKAEKLGDRLRQYDKDDPAVADIRAIFRAAWGRCLIDVFKLDLEAR